MNISSMSQQSWSTEKTTYYRCMNLVHNRTMEYGDLLN